jgi:signal peptidase I
MSQAMESEETLAGDDPESTDFWREDVPTLVLAIVVALIVRTFVFQTFYVPSSSMLPTLLIGDHVFVNKFVYGPRVPGLDWRAPGVREPERGEVIVFQFARSPKGGIYPPDVKPELPTDNFVKRLVGMPGDRIAYRNGRLILNGEPVPLEDTGLKFEDERGIVRDVYIETLGECRHVVLDDPNDPGPGMREKTIAEGRYLFMGDNRDNSHDGRKAGTVRLMDLSGPAGLNYWSWDWNGSWFSLLNPVTWYDNLTSKMRWSRMGSSVDCLEPGEVPEL